MSAWTYIVGVLNVDTCTANKNIKNYAEKMLKNAPAITGSERNASVFVNICPGYNLDIGMNCDECQYRDTVKHLGCSTYECDAPDDYDCSSGDFQTEIVITVHGELRDKSRETTLEEWKAFKRFIKKELNWDILNCSYKIKNII